MIEITVKTLDGKNRTYSVPDDITVKQFKEKIAESIEITADSQRLIYQGRVLQDDKKINDFDVHGKTIHVVQRPPPRANTSPEDGATPSGGASRTGNQGNRDTFVLGSFTLPSDVMDPNQVQNVVQQVLSGMGDVGRNASVNTRASTDGSSVDVHINLGQVAGPEIQSGSQNRVNIVRRMLRNARRTLDRLENPPTGTEGAEAPMETDSPGDETPEAGTPTTRSASATPDAGTPDRETAPTPGSESAATTGEAGTASADAGAQSGPETRDATTNTGANPNRTGQRRRLTHPAPPVLGQLFGEVFELNQRLQPHMERYQQLMNDDPNFSDNEEEGRAAQRVCNLVSETLHFISHAYHAVSDIMIDMSHAPPRQLRAPPGVIQQTIPVQTQINIGHVAGGPAGSPRLVRRPQPYTTTHPATSTSSTATSSSGGQSQPRGPVPRMFQMFGPTPPPGMARAGAPGGGAAPAPGQQQQQGQRVQMGHMPIYVELNTAAGGPGTPGGGANGQGQGQAPPQGAPAPGMMLPPNLLQNIIQMATQGAMRGAQGVQGHQQVFVMSGGQVHPSQTPPTMAQNSGATSTNTTPSSSSATPSATQGGSTTSTSTSTSSSTAGGGGTGGPRPAAFAMPAIPGLIPGMPGLIPGMMPGMMPFAGLDPFLPCQSRHLLAHRAQHAARSHAAAQSQNPEQALAGVVGNVVTGLMNQQGIRPPTSGAAPSQAAGQGGPNRPRQAAPGVNPAAPLATQLRDLLQQGQQAAAARGGGQSGGQQSAGGAGGGGAGQQGTGVSDEVFAQLVSGIGSQVSRAALGGQQQSDTIADFLTNLGQNYQISQGEGIFTDIFNCISQHLTFMDLMSIFFGQHAALQRVRTPLQQFIRDKILNGQEYNTTNLHAAVERLLEDMQPEIEAASSEVTARDDINFQSTLSEFARQQMRNVLTFIMEAREDNQEFGRNLYRTIQTAIHEFVVLSRYCLEGGTQALDNLVQGRVRSIANDINPMIQMWMVTVSSQQLHQLLPTISLPDSQIERYVVRGGASASPKSQSSDASFMSAESGNADIAETMSVGSDSLAAAAQEVAACNAEEMDVDEGLINGSGGPVSGHPRIPREVLSGLAPPPRADPTDHAEVALGSADWHTAVPQDWVPLITRDVSRQRRTGAQPPFSDAYLSGMPAKRRKIMQGAGGDELSNVQNVMPEAIKRAAQAVGAQAQTPADRMCKEAAANSALHSAFQDEIEVGVRHRLQNDPDYTPEKYPNAEKFFNTKR